MSRPLMNLQTEELQKYLPSWENDVGMLRQLDEELRHRSSRPAEALRGQVKALLTQVRASSRERADGAASSAEAEPMLVTPEPPEPPKPPGPPRRTGQSNTKRGRAPKQDSAGDTEDLLDGFTSDAVSSEWENLVATTSEDEARKVLKVTANARWEDIEQARRLVVDHAHPHKLKELPEPKRSQVREHACHANASAIVLARRRTAGA